MNTIRKFQQPIVNVNRLLMKSKSFSTMGNTTTKTEKDSIGVVKDMSIHGLCFDSMKLAFNNFKQYIMKQDSVKLALGRWNVKKVSAEWEKKGRYY